MKSIILVITFAAAAYAYPLASTIVSAPIVTAVKSIAAVPTSDFAYAEKTILPPPIVVRNVHVPVYTKSVVTAPLALGCAGLGCGGYGGGYGAGYGAGLGLGGVGLGGIGLGGHGAGLIGGGLIGNGLIGGGLIGGGLIGGLGKGLH